jgi:uroporphyrinogen-III synthase
VLLLPLIEIVPVADPAPLRAAWARLSAYEAVMFVSGNAVREFIAAAAGAAWPAGTQAWSTGPGTAAALQEAQVPASQVATPPPPAGRFDSEALWLQVGDRVRPGWRVLVVRGGGPDGSLGRDWLARQLASAGASVDQVVAYERRRPEWTAAQREVAQGAAADGSVWLLSSSEAIANLRALLPGLDLSRTRAVATHERIAQAAQAAGFGHALPAAGTVDAVARALESCG